MENYKDRLCKKIQKDELEEVLHEAHSRHFNIRTAYDKFQPDFHFLQMYKQIKEYLEASISKETKTQ